MNLVILGTIGYVIILIFVVFFFIGASKLNEKGKDKDDGNT